MKASRRMGLFLLGTGLGFLLMIGLAGCSWWPGSYEEIAWQEQVLWTQECGLEDMRCCPDREPVCDEGLSCCQSPIEPEMSMCRDKCGCGLEGNFCCAEGDLCGEDMICQNQICRLCGQEDQPCCGGGVCGGDLVCHQDVCVPCGVVGNPCCQSEPACQDQDKEDTDRAECLEGLCRNCGFGGKPACPRAPVCAPANLLNNGNCLNCGGINEPCCRRETATSTTAFCTEAGYTCQAGFCINN